MATNWSINRNDAVVNTPTIKRYYPAEKFRDGRKAGTFWRMNVVQERQIFAISSLDGTNTPKPWPRYRSQMRPSETVSLWGLVMKFSGGQGVGRWEFIGNINNTDGNDTEEQVSKTAKQNKKAAKERKERQARNGPKKVDATFVNAEGWDIKANAPMLTVNYPDMNFLALQTDPYEAVPEKRQTQTQKDIVRGGGKGYSSSSKGKVDSWAKGSKLPSTKVKTKVVSTGADGLLGNKVRLGFIEQDINLHSDLASTQGIQSKQKAKKDQYKGGHRWRFKFHYNPATVNVSQTYNTEMDPLFIKKDPVASIQSGSSVSFDLYLNRVEEMQLLNHDGSYRQGPKSAVDDEYLRWMWRGKIDQATRKAIRNRGTLYDIEYLYRVCNGEPLPDLWKGDSADYGILFGQPLRMHFTNVKSDGIRVGMNYYGYISSLSMDHQMFSMDMVPSLTRVQIIFTRIPDTLALDSKKLGEAYAR